MFILFPNLLPFGQFNLRKGYKKSRQAFGSKEVGEGDGAASVVHV